MPEAQLRDPAGKPPEPLTWMAEEFLISIPIPISISFGVSCAAHSGEREEPDKGFFIQSAAKLQAQDLVPREAPGR
ncbi:MAG: hypothetical protein WCZ10_13000, partial [Desulfobulbaceae bacterium]